MTVTEFPDLARAREEAAGWIARSDRGLDRAERGQFRQWCAASPANPRALRQLTQMWSALDVMRVLPEVLPEPGSAPGPVANPRASPGVVAVIAASVMVVATVAWSVLEREAPLQTRDATTTYATAVGEHRDLQLADGSSLSLNTGTLVEVGSLQGATRELRLLRGEAVFTVARDVTRPFRVHVGDRLVEAVGTEFDIRLHDAGHVEVLVTDGRIRLGTGAVTDHADSGDAVTIATDGAVTVTHLDAQSLGARLAWRHGMVAFAGQPLSEALEEFSRHTPVRFVVADPATQRRPVGGTVPAGDVASLLEALRTNLGLESSRAADGSIHISPQR